MATLRTFKCYRRIKRPYTRVSKFKKKSYVRGAPPSKIVRYDMGELNKKFSHRVDLICKENIQIRSNALESARLVSNRRMQEKLGKTSYYYKLRIYPYHILRENKMLSGAGADRMQTGMAHSFGKPVGVAAQVKKGQVIFTAYVDKDGVEIAKESLKLCAPRLPGKYSVEVSENK